MTEIILDSSQISTFLECPRLWYYKYKLNRRPSGSKLALNKGTLMHDLLELYYMDPSPARTGALLAALVKCLDEKTIQPFLDLGLPTTLTFQELAEDSDFLAVALRFTDYTVRYMSSDFKVAKSPSGATATELGFSKILHESETDRFILEGRIDLLIDLGESLKNQIAWVDHKTQKMAIDLYQHSPQFRTYDLVLNWNSPTIGYGMINYVGLQDKLNPRSFRRDLITFQPHQREEWRDYLVNVFRSVAETMAQLPPDPTPNFKSCAGPFGSNPCDFAPVCEAPDSQKLMTLKSQFIEVEPWRPW